MARQAFTIAEANAALDLLRGLLDRVCVLRARAREYGDRLALLELVWGRTVRALDNPDHHEHAAFRQAISGVRVEMEAIILELIVHRGVRFPPGGLEHGLVHFPYRVARGWVYLCWNRDEARVKHWHELDAGCERRRPLPPAGPFGPLGAADGARAE